MAEITITLKDILEADGSTSVDVMYSGNERLNGNVDPTSITAAELLFFALFGVVEFSSYSGIVETVTAVEELLSQVEGDDLDDDNTDDDDYDYGDTDGRTSSINDILSSLSFSVPLDNINRVNKSTALRLVVDNEATKEDK